MSAVSVAALAPFAPARHAAGAPRPARASRSLAPRPLAIGPPRVPARRATFAIRASGPQPRASAPAAPRESPIARLAAGRAPAPRAPTPPGAAVDAARDALARVVRTVWAARKGLACAAFAVCLALLDASPAFARGRGGGRSGGRMGGSSFRSAGSRSMGGGMHGAGAMGGGAGMGAGMGAGASRAPSSSAAAASAARAAPPQSRGGFGFMPSFFFMPSFGWGGYGYGMMGPGYMIMRVFTNLLLAYLIFNFLFGGRRNNDGGNAQGA